MGGRATWVVALAAAAAAGCGEMPKGIIEKQRDADARNAAAAERAAEAAATERLGTERFNVVALEAEANRILAESNARIEAQRAEQEALLPGGDKPQPDKPAGEE